MLRPYQLDLDVRRRTSTARRVLVQLPTGGGKSLLIREAVVPHLLVLVHAEYLLDQLHALIGGHVLRAGGEWQGWPTIAMVQTATRRDIPAPDKIIVDEAHHAVAGSWANIIVRYPEARIEGFTATPARLDGQGLGGSFDELLCGPSYQELITAGWLKPFQLMSVPSGVDMSEARKRAGEFAQEDVKAAVRRSTIFGDVVEHYLRHARHLGGHASFWPSIEMAEEAAGRFQREGVACYALHSKIGRDPQELIRLLRKGTVESLATVGMIGEGLDVPGLSSVSLCRPTASLSVYLQQAGRCNRGGSGIALVLDHVQNYARHGLPDDDREWSLLGRVKRKAAPGVLPVWSCPACWAVTRSTQQVCSRCGAPKPRELREIEEKAAELEVITRADVGDVHGLCGSPAEYVAFAKAHSKTPIWAALQWAQRDKRARDDNPFLAAAGQVRPTMQEFLAAGEACGLHSMQARAAGRALGLRH